MSVLVLTGSARRDSYTRQLGEALVAGLDSAALAPRLTELPFFDQDLEPAPPAEVEALRAQVAAADAVVVITPEYNGTIPGLLGNAGAQVLGAAVTVDAVDQRLQDGTVSAVVAEVAELLEAPALAA